MRQPSRDIVVVAPQSPFPPEQGAALRNLNIVAHLVRNWRVHLLYFSTGGYGVPTELENLCASVHPILLPRRSAARRLAEVVYLAPDLVRRLYSPVFEMELRRVVQQWQPCCIQCEGLEVFPYALEVDVPIILDAHNAEWVLQWRAATVAFQRAQLAPALYSLIQTVKLRRYEREAIRKAHTTISVSASDRADLLHLLPGARIEVLPNGVDPEVYSPLPIEAPLGESLLFAGKMDFRPNIEGALWLAKRVMPLLWRQRPGLRLILFGSFPTTEVADLGRDPRITVTGHVPGVEAEKRALASATVVVVPLFSGGGTRLKVLNALAMARPLVSTHLGAAGYGLRDGEHLLLADSAEAFATHVSHLLDDRTLASKLGNQGREFVVRRFSWERLVPALDSVYAEVLDA
ncbi:MAG: glycosyltransferase family 4 protein [Chloroflexi bacterium]|nr:glycosyltransferase family 4 protein [Chloroflexota bacterium]